LIHRPVLLKFRFVCNDAKENFEYEKNVILLNIVFAIDTMHLGFNYLRSVFNEALASGNVG